MDRGRGTPVVRAATLRKSISTPLPGHSSISKRDSLGASRGELPMKDKEVVLDIMDRKKCESLKVDIKKMGGVVVDFVSEDKPPFLIVSDHPMSVKLQEMKIHMGGHVDPQLMKRLPLLLKDGVRQRIRVRHYTTFVESLSKAMSRFKASRVSVSRPPVPSAPQKSRSSGPDNSVRQLAEPFIKFEDISGVFAPCYKEMSVTTTSNFTTLYVGKYFGHSLFHKATTEQQDRREREIEEEQGQVVLLDDEAECPSPPRPANVPVAKARKGGFCEVCAKTCENLRSHYASKEHLTTINRPGFYDEVDCLLGSYVDHIKIPGSRTLIRQQSANRVRSGDCDGDYEYSEGTFRRNSRTDEPF